MIPDAIIFSTQHSTGKEVFVDVFLHTSHVKNMAEIIFEDPGEIYGSPHTLLRMLCIEMRDRDPDSTISMNDYAYTKEAIISDNESIDALLLVDYITDKLKNKKILIVSDTTTKLITCN